VAIIQHIPQAMLQSLGFMALLFLLYEAIQFSIKPSPNQNYILAGCLFGTAVVHFLIVVFVASNSNITRLVIPIAVANQIQWITMIGYLYLCIIIGYLIQLLFQGIKLVQLKSTADFNVKMHLSHLDDLNDWIKIQWQSTGSKRKLQIGFSNHVAGPVTFGWLEPIILMPFSMLNQLSTAEIKFILLHEMAHILRHDFIFHLFLEFAQLILCFNPFAFYFSRKIRVEREKACDDWVIAQTHAPVLYTKALYQLAKYNYSNRHTLSIAAVDNVSELMCRIKHINGLMTPFNDTKSYISKLVIGACFVLFLFLKPTNSATIISKKSIHSQNKTIATVSNFKQKNSTETISKVGSKTSAQVNSNTNIQTNSSLAYNTKQIENSDSMYQALVHATLAWIKSRESNENGQVIFARYDTQKDSSDYSIAEQLLLKALLHKYELKRTILANSITKVNSQEEAMILMKNSKEWIELQQYEKWASSFLKQHPNMKDSSMKLSDF
jgi:beta-lactamase regulating signal transducer with metallopeptidase domain